MTDEPCTHSRIHREADAAPSEHGFVFRWMCYHCGAPFVEGSKLDVCVKRLDVRYDDDGAGHDEIDRLTAAAQEGYDRAIAAESRLGSVCRVEHAWRASLFHEYSTPHWVCDHCGKAEPKTIDEWHSQVRVVEKHGQNLVGPNGGPYVNAKD
jgi:hypothetical protein